MQRKSSFALAAGAGALLLAAASSTAAAAGAQTVRCVGDGDFCRATVKIGGGVSDRTVTVRLSDSDLRLVRVTPLDALAHGPYAISDVSTRLGGSQLRFRLDAASANPKRARLVLLFAAGTPPRDFAPAPLRTTRTATATLNVGRGMSVSIRGGGSGTSNCTNDETNETFVTRSDSETHNFGFYSRGSGMCVYEMSWSNFVFTVKDPSGKLVGEGVARFGQGETFGSYRTWCQLYENPKWSGISCDAGNHEGNVTIERVY